ncbi:MAG: MFS transporter [Rhodothermales bacterium]|nr:MFS transporter [Rhodothermales bacterium]
MNEHISDSHARRLFLGSCIALISTSVAFATVGAVMLSLKSEFVLSNAQVGWIGGAALWGFAVSQLVFAPLCDTLGMRFLLRMSFAGHIAGTLVMVFASGFWMLFTGALIIALANGLVEAACNPLVATLYPDNKTVKLNQFHVWFPGGIVLGGLAAYGLDAVSIESWQIKLALIIVPTIIYGFLLLREEFPQTEGVQSGVSMGEMFKATFTTPLMLLALVCIAMTGSVELGPNRWVPAVMESGGLPGILVLVWINGLMAVMRYRAGDVVHRLSPTGILLASAVVAGIGLYWLSYAETGVVAFAAATVFALGVCYFWPTMLGFVSERIPKTGALGLGLMGAVAMFTVGLVTAPQMGRIADEYAHRQFEPEVVSSVLESSVQQLREDIPTVPEPVATDMQTAIDASSQVVDYYEETGDLPELSTADAMRLIISSGAEKSVTQPVNAILGPADNYGGRISFRYVVPLCGVLAIIFLLLFLGDRKRGGYQVVRINEHDGEDG